ncbi:2-hydroxyacid dehydrogenase [Laceyella putida]|uniref:2-hydroxyacid dehydrogenase n=1 Tax=Laceyella putida TaxID=110101 RepID=A0ABW2RKX5_9BACL
MRPRVVVTRDIGKEPLARLAELADVVLLPAGWTTSALIKELQTSEALLCNVTDTIDRELLRACPGLRIISNYGVGYNHIDVAYANERQIIVTNTPGVLTEATADLTWALLLDVSRRVSEGDRFVRQGRWAGWEPLFMLGREVSGKSLGIIGMGRIGKAVAERAKGFRMRVVYCSRTRLPLEQEASLGVTFANLEQCLSEVDYVTIHCPYTPETHHLIGAAELSKMKSTAYLVNTARGPIVDEQALIVALKEGRIAGAALDVYEDEPHVPEALRQMEQVVLAPHLGSATFETRLAMADLAVRNLTAYFQGETPPHVVTG